MTKQMSFVIRIREIKWKKKNNNFINNMSENKMKAAN